MVGRTALGTLPTLALVAAVPASAGGYAFPIDIPAGALSSALKDLARQTGVELLYDRGLVRAFRSPRVQGRLTVEAALQRLLVGTELAMRRAASGAWVIERRTLAPAAAAPALPPPVEDAPEILVVGRRTQNVDIRRRENDVQPYQVTTGEQIARAQRDDLDQYFRSRVTPNTQVVPPSLQTGGQTNSQVDLRGLGADQTLILVDGRRMPSIPVEVFGFGQPDLNAIPLHAIERVETLTGTAGGIHGFGALGGVVNVVLRRDYRGVELHGAAGISTRGDAGRLSLEARLGFTPDDGRTDVMLYVAHSRSQPLLEGQRGYMRRARSAAARLAPDRLAGLTPTANSLGVFNFLEGDLVFKPEYGGASLGSSYTFLPKGFAGTPAELIASLTQRAGQIDITTTDAEAASGLTSAPTTTSAILNVRHRFDGGVEAYFDALMFRNRGWSLGHESNADLVLFPDSPMNPFDNVVWLTFPALPIHAPRRTIYLSERYTAGVIVPLPHGWKGNAEATLGGMRYDRTTESELYYQGPLIPDGTESPDFNPFGNWEAFQRSLAAYQQNVYSSVRSHNRYREQSLRMAGPVFATAAGPTVLTMLLQNREEKIPAFSLALTADVYDPPTSYQFTAARSITTQSLYAELRAPLIRDDARIPLLKGLELQLAVRRDRQRLLFSRDPTVPDSQDVVHPEFSGTAYTIGTKFLPMPWLMLRASYATGQQPPPFAALIPLEYTDFSDFLIDPKRGNDYFTDTGDYLYKTAGSPDLTTVKASTWSLGLVLNPLGDNGPRFSLDYSRVRRVGDPNPLDTDVVLAHEASWPARVTREPLTDADRALGYTGGRITMIDARAINGGSLTVDSIDARLDWTAPFGAGFLRTYGSGTLQLHNKKQELFVPGEERTGYRNGPLKWRANGGAEWTLGATTIGANLQYFSRYRVYEQKYAGSSGSDILLQGSKWVRPQMYLDLFVSHRFPIRWAGSDRAVGVDLGIVNVFDQAPPYETFGLADGPQYSFYGDPRRRRLELTLNSSF
jgi:outer membrane receptor protein involved in Fe transport